MLNMIDNSDLLGSLNSAVPIKKMLMFIILLASLFTSITPVQGDGLIPERVQRRLTGDTYTYTMPVDNKTHETCENTFLVDDDQCVMDQELFKGRSNSFSMMCYH